MWTDFPWGRLEAADWPLYAPNEVTLRIAGAPQLTGGYRDAECDFWDAVLSGG